MRPRTKESERHVEALVSAMRIIDCFQSDEGLQLKDLHYRTGIGKSKILRLAGSMEACGALTYDEEQRKYRLGAKLYHYGRMIGDRYRSIVHEADPILAELADRTGGVCYISVLHGFDRLVICRRPPGGVTERVVKDGQVKPLHIGANSIMVLAHQPAETLQRIVSDLQTRPGIQLSDDQADRLLCRTARAREDGWAVSYGESKPGYYVVSVPIFARDGAFCGALGLSNQGGEESVSAATAEAHLLKEASLQLRSKLRDARAGF